MNDTDQIKPLLSLFAIQLPTLLVCFVAGVVILGRWKQGSMWALFGFGLLGAHSGSKRWRSTTSNQRCSERLPVPRLRFTMIRLSRFQFRLAVGRRSLSYSR